MTNDAVCWSAPIATDGLDHAETLSYWGVESVDQPLRLVACLGCDGFVCGCE